MARNPEILDEREPATLPLRILTLCSRLYKLFTALQTEPGLSPVLFAGTVAFPPRPPRTPQTPYIAAICKTSFQVAKTISMRTNASPIRNPISCVRALKGRPRTASKA